MEFHLVCLGPMVTENLVTQIQSHLGQESRWLTWKGGQPVQKQPPGAEVLAKDEGCLKLAVWKEKISDKY